LSNIFCGSRKCVKEEMGGIHQKGILQTPGMRLWWDIK
jgi:hypothetical protein